MNTYLESIILGAVQGITEFLPVSSSGHLALLEHLGIGNENLLFNLMLHVATLLVVIIAFWKEIVYCLKNPLSKTVRFVVLASIPTMILAAAVRYFLPFSVKALPFCFVLTAVILILPSIIKSKSEFSIENDNSKKWMGTAVFTGVFQGIATLGGVSRSGMTVTSLQLSGVNREESARLSFLLSIPIILGSAIVELLTKRASSVQILPLLVAMVTAFVLGLLAVKVFLKLLHKCGLWVFSPYLIVLAILSFIALY